MVRKALAVLARCPDGRLAGKLQVFRVRYQKAPHLHRKETREWNRHSRQSRPPLILCFRAHVALIELRLTLIPEVIRRPPSSSTIGWRAPGEPRFSRRTCPKETTCSPSMRALQTRRPKWAVQSRGSRQLIMRVPQMSSCLRARAPQTRTPLPNCAAGTSNRFTGKYFESCAITKTQKTSFRKPCSRPPRT